MSKKDKYSNFCESGVFIPIFSKPWWLDAVCGKDGWDVAIVEKSNEVWAAMPYYIKNKNLMQLITIPQLTRFLGPLIKYPPEQKLYRKLSWEKEIMYELISQIPKFDIFFQNWYYDYTNWLPFYWKKFNQRTNYSYYIPASTPIEKIEDNYESATRRRIKKSINSGVVVIENNDIENLYNLINETYARKGMSNNKSLSFLISLFDKIVQYNSGKILLAKHNEKVVAGGLFIYDSRDYYYLAGGILEEYKDLGAMDLVIDHSIKEALSKGKNFDFEGSMNENIENYFRRFGSMQRPYFFIYKINSLPAKLLMYLDIIKY